MKPIRATHDTYGSVVILKFDRRQGTALIVRSNGELRWVPTHALRIDQNWIVDQAVRK